MNPKFPNILIITLLLLAVLDLPYGYYTLLRIIVCLYSGIIAFNAYKQERKFWFFSSTIIFLLFNPIIPIYFDKGLWIIIDISIAVYFIIFSVKKPVSTKLGG